MPRIGDPKIKYDGNDVMILDVGFFQQHKWLMAFWSAFVLPETLHPILAGSGKLAAPGNVKKGYRAKLSHQDALNDASLCCERWQWMPILEMVLIDMLNPDSSASEVESLQELKRELWYFACTSFALQATLVLLCNILY